MKSIPRMNFVCDSYAFVMVPRLAYETRVIDWSIKVFFKLVLFWVIARCTWFGSLLEVEYSGLWEL